MKPLAGPERAGEKPRRIDPACLDLAQEFRAGPIGHHSPGLDAVLSILRSGQVAGKLCLICVAPHTAWVIGRLSGVRGVAPVIHDDRVFHSIASAEWAVFKLRWSAEFGQTIDDDAE